MARDNVSNRRSIRAAEIVADSAFQPRSLLRIAVRATVCLLALAAASEGLLAQTSETFEFLPTLLVCVLPPSPPPPPAPWPVAATDSLVAIAGTPLTFTRATLLANDAGAALTVVGVVPTSSAGGTIAGTNPLTYTPPPAFTGQDIFAYEVSDSFGQTTAGIVKVSVSVDALAPTVSITAPHGGTVSGTVVVTALASDNAGVAGVTFFDGIDQIGVEDTAAPFQTPWDTRVVADGSHSLTAIARDVSGNRATSASVAVTVSNAARRRRLRRVSCSRSASMKRTAQRRSISQAATGTVSSPARCACRAKPAARSSSTAWTTSSRSPIPPRWT